MNALTPFGEVEQDSTNNQLSVFKDPFQHNCIDEIIIQYRRPIFATKHIWQARVEFKNDLTTGQQKTPECNTWEELMLQLKSIYSSLEVKPQ